MALEKLSITDGCLFVDEVCTFRGSAGPWTTSVARREFSSPEDIDEGPATAPSKRILQVVPDYSKVAMSPLAIEEIGLASIRSQCPHFDGWLRRLESLGR